MVRNPCMGPSPASSRRDHHRVIIVSSHFHSNPLSPSSNCGTPKPDRSTTAYSRLRDQVVCSVRPPVVKPVGDLFVFLNPLSCLISSSGRLFVRSSSFFVSLPFLPVILALCTSCLSLFFSLFSTLLLSSIPVRAPLLLFFVLVCRVPFYSRLQYFLLLPSLLGVVLRPGQRRLEQGTPTFRCGLFGPLSLLSHELVERWHHSLFLIGECLHRRGECPWIMPLECPVPVDS